MRGFAFLAGLTEEERMLAGDQHQRRPFLALSAPQSTAHGGKPRHKAKERNRPVLLVSMRNPAGPSNSRQSAANDAFSAC
jgi:hypothetical protein